MGNLIHILVGCLVAVKNRQMQKYNVEQTFLKFQKLVSPRV